MLDAIEIHINRIAQNAISFDEGIRWFNHLSPEEKHRVLLLLTLYIEQAKPCQDVIDKGIDNIPLKTTMTPFVIFRTNRFTVAVNKIAGLPAYESDKSFIALMTVFLYADTERRKTQCKDGCSHEWHNLDAKNSESRMSFAKILRRLLNR